MGSGRLRVDGTQLRDDIVIDDVIVEVLSIMERAGR